MFLKLEATLLPSPCGLLDVVHTKVASLRPKKNPSRPKSENPLRPLGPLVRALRSKKRHQLINSGQRCWVRANTQVPPAPPKSLEPPGAAAGLGPLWTSTIWASHGVGWFASVRVRERFVIPTRGERPNHTTRGIRGPAFRAKSAMLPPAQFTPPARVPRAQTPAKTAPGRGWIIDGLVCSRTRKSEHCTGSPLLCTGPLNLFNLSTFKLPRLAMLIGFSMWSGMGNVRSKTLLTRTRAWA